VAYQNSSLRVVGLARGAEFTFTFDGETLPACTGESVAIALLAAERRKLGDGPAQERPRSAFCFMGTCQQCLVRVEGRLVQACLVPVSAGLAVTSG